MMPAKKPTILITNDDGITAPGLHALANAMSPLGKIVIVAPDGPQSATGHAITMHKPIRLRKDKILKGNDVYKCSGTPVDCVKLAVNEVLHYKPDLCVSGINHGPNSSINVIYSGTMSAAVEGAIEGIPSIGFSLFDHSEDADFTASVKYARIIASTVLKRGIQSGTCLNVNIPKGKPSEIKGIKICRQALSKWTENFLVRKDPSGETYYWLTGKFNQLDKGEDTDEWALRNNYISIVPTQFDLTAHHTIAELNGWKL